MDPLMDVIKNSEEPEWLERPVIGEVRLWQLVFLCFAGMTTLMVMVCCCFRFRIPRTKQQIEADYHRRRITTKFRRQLETIQDSKMDAMSLQDGMETSFQPVAPSATTDDQEPGMSFVKFAGKVAILSKLAPKSPTSPSPSESKINVEFFSGP